MAITYVHEPPSVVTRADTPTPRPQAPTPPKRSRGVERKASERLRRCLTEPSLAAGDRGDVHSVRDGTAESKSTVEPARSRAARTDPGKSS